MEENMPVGTAIVPADNMEPQQAAVRLVVKPHAKLDPAPTVWKVSVGLMLTVPKSLVPQHWTKLLDAPTQQV
jgi:hypothetical protein